MNPFTPEPSKLGSGDDQNGRLSPYTDFQHGGVNEDSTEGCQLIIQGIVPAVTKGALRTFFSAFNAQVSLLLLSANLTLTCSVCSVSISLPLNPQTHHHDGNGCVVFKTAVEADEAMRRLSGKQLHGRKVQLTISRKSNPNVKPFGLSLNDIGSKGGEPTNRNNSCVRTSRQALEPSSSMQHNKKIKAERTDDPRLSRKSNNATTEELNLRLRQQILSNLGRNSKEEDAKIKELSEGRQKIRSQLLQQSGRKENIAPYTPSLTPTSLSNIQYTPKASWPDSANGSQTLTQYLGQQLPQESPLQNVMNFANLEEEIVQTKIRYAMAEKTLRLERQALGRATEDTIDRVKTSGKALADMYERRDAIRADRERVEVFRLASTRPVPSPRQRSAVDYASIPNGESKADRQENERSASAGNLATGPVTKLESDTIALSEEGEVQESQTTKEAQVMKQPQETCNVAADENTAATHQVRFAVTDLEANI